MIRYAQRKTAAMLGAVVMVLLLAAHSYAITVPGGPAPPLSHDERRQHFILMLVYIAIALCFSFLCSVAEAVLLSVTPSFIQRLEKDKKRGAGLLKKIKQNIDRSLAAILTLNTIAHTVGAGGAGAEAAKTFGDRYVNVAMAILTLLILFLSEIIPKTIGAVYWRRLSIATARFVQMLIWVLYPLILVSEVLTKLLTKGKNLHSFSREEFAAMADIGAAGGHLDAKESRILKNLFLFPELRAEDIMTPRTVMLAIQQDKTISQVFEEHSEVTFSRIPIYAENIDEVTGFVLTTELLIKHQQGEGDTKLSDLKRDLRAVNRMTPLTRVLEDLLDNRSHIMLVVSDYGGTEGLVTLEDVVETLIGFEIVDEVDEIDDMRKLAREKWQERMKKMGISVE